MQSTRVCSVDGCCREAGSHGMCTMHRRRFNKTGSPLRQCYVCGEDMPEGIPQQQRRCDTCVTCIIDGCEEPLVSRGLCSTHDARYKYAGSPVHKCKGCGVELSKGSWSRYSLCDSCRVCSVEGCNHSLLASGLCHRHYYRLQYMGGLRRPCEACGEDITIEMDGRTKYCSDECRPELTKRNHVWYRKKVLRGEVPAICRICDKKIDLDLQFPAHESLSVDHIVPISLGGTNREANLRPAHYACNIRRGNKLLPPLAGTLTLF